MKARELDDRSTKSLNRDITNFEELPEKSDHDLRVISYNITVDFFDGKDKTEGKIHQWKNRASACKKLIEEVNPDIFCLQELSPGQASELYKHFNELGYDARFLSQTPSDVKAGSIADGAGVAEWIGKNIGTMLVGTFFSNKWTLLENGCFWLNNNPDDIPTSEDRGKIDKGFGNMNTYRAVFSTKFKMNDKEINENQDSKPLYVFNSHYPLSGNNNTRLGCAEVEMKQIQKIAGNGAWISAGDRNLIPGNDEAISLENAYKAFLVNGSMDIRDVGNHYGISTSWIGFTYDDYRNPIKAGGGDFRDNTVLDLMLSNLPAKQSFHLHGAFELKENSAEPELMPLTGELNEGFSADRSFVSDHALIGADFSIDYFG